MIKQTSFMCSFCDKRLKREAAFLKHRCKEMIRDEDFKTHSGQCAWRYYQSWMNLNKRFLADDPDIFLNSPFFKQFMNFAHFTKQVDMVDVKLFIKLMINDNIPPNMWTMPEAHSLYLNRIDRLKSANELVNITVDTLFALSDKFDVDICDIFNVITPNEVTLLIQRHRLSPWLLLRSPKFIQFLDKKTSTEERIILTQVVKFDFWYDKFSKFPQEKAWIKEVVAELNL